MKIKDEFLSKLKKQLFIDIFFEFKDAITFDKLKIELLDSTIEFSIKIYIIPHQF